jgi:RNA polymerase sporulation-specific sigma factor
LETYEDQSIVAYKKYDDCQLVNMANTGDQIAEQQIIEKYKKLVKLKAKTYFLVGADREDIIQEGMIGLYKAIRGYDSLKIASFKTFAELCINRQILTAVKMASRKKHKPLNFSISLNQPISCDDSNKTLYDLMDDENIDDPMNLFLTKERFREIKLKLKDMLSKLEIQVLESYIEGKSYKEIALEIKKNTKSIDNAIQRIKTKLEFADKLN